MIAVAPPQGARRLSDDPSPGRADGRRWQLRRALVGAMRGVAAVATDDAITRARADAERCIVELQAEEASRSDGLRRASGIRLATERAELAAEEETRIAAIELEAERRVGERLARLDADLARFAERARCAEAAVWRIVGDYETELERSFALIMPGVRAAAGPDVIIELMRSLPEPPSLSGTDSAVAQATSSAPLEDHGRPGPGMRLTARGSPRSRRNENAG